MQGIPHSSAWTAIYLTDPCVPVLEGYADQLQHQIPGTYHDAEGEVRGATFRDARLGGSADLLVSRIRDVALWTSATSRLAQIALYRIDAQAWSHCDRRLQLLTRVGLHAIADPLSFQRQIIESSHLLFQRAGAMMPSR
jgi:hypothetical protein